MRHYRVRYKLATTDNMEITVIDTLVYRINRVSQVLVTRCMYRTLTKEGPLQNISPPPYFGLNFLLRSNIYLNMRHV